jgi:hypothetical protein
MITHDDAIKLVDRRAEQQMFVTRCTPAASVQHVSENESVVVRVHGFDYPGRKKTQDVFTLDPKWGPKDGKEKTVVAHVTVVPYAGGIPRSVEINVTFVRP